MIAVATVCDGEIVGERLFGEHYPRAALKFYEDKRRNYECLALDVEVSVRMTLEGELLCESAIPAYHHGVVTHEVTTEAFDRLLWN